MHCVEYLGDKDVCLILKLVKGFAVILAVMSTKSKVRAEEYGVYCTDFYLWLRLEVRRDQITKK